jgi:peptidoglycan/xylan/chitin deacetylase (PgdA/CDA1 family)
MRALLGGVAAVLVFLLAVSGDGWGGQGRADRRMVVTIDDLPAQRADRLPIDRFEAITRGIVKVLKRERIPAVGFVNEQKLEVGGTVDPRRVALLAQWLDAGLELGNHTYSHPDLHHIPREDFERNILRGEVVTRPLAAAHGKPWRYFRHPYLHTGRDLATRDAVLRFLGEHGYQVAPVTVDNAEWIFAFAYEDAVAKKDRALQRRLAAAYLDYMDAMVAYHEGQSRALFDREIPQILLIHANSLNGDHLDDLIKRLRRRGYRFTDLPTALRDPAYASPDTFTGGGGITWFHRWGITRGVDRAVFQGEPRVPKWVQEVAGIKE